MKNRKGNSKTERIGLNYVEKITIDAGHIFRNVLEEDVGIDADIEICRNDIEPTGILIGVQIKTGESYIRSEKNDSFVYYPSTDDLKYWHEYSLPVYLFIYRQKLNVAYWSDIKEFLNNYKFEDIIAGIAPNKIIISKDNVFSKKFFNIFERKHDIYSMENWYNQFLQNLMDVSLKNKYDLPLEILKSLLSIDIGNAKKLLEYLNFRNEELINTLIGRGLTENDSNEYINNLTVKLRSIIFDKENTGFILIVFEKKERRDEVLKRIEEIIPFNHYLILEGEMMMPFLPMNYSILIASDCWENGQIEINMDFLNNLESKFGLTWNIDYDIGYYSSLGASRFVAPAYFSCNPGFIFYVIYDTKNNYYLFDYLRLFSREKYEQDSNEYLWFSIAEDRIKLYYSWDPALYGFFQCVISVRNGEELNSYQCYLLEWEFEISSKEDIENFIEKVKAAKSLRDLPFVNDSMIDSIKKGMEWGSS